MLHTSVVVGSLNHPGTEQSAPVLAEGDLVQFGPTVSIVGIVSGQSLIIH